LLLPRDKKTGRSPDFGLSTHHAFPSKMTVADCGFRSLYSCGAVLEFHQASLDRIWVDSISVIRDAIVVEN